MADNVAYLLWQKNANAAPSELIDKEYVEVLEAATKSKLTTAAQVVLAIGKLGSYKGPTRKYRDPGLKVLWIGWSKLMSMVQGWRLAMEKNRLQD